jgi:hypothetical protein
MGSDVIFKRGTTFAAACVAWSDDNSAGLSFYREISEAQVLGSSDFGDLGHFAKV